MELKAMLLITAFPIINNALNTTVKKFGHSNSSGLANALDTLILGVVLIVFSTRYIQTIG